MAGDLVVGLDAREAFRFQPRGIGLYGRHLIREFGALCPEVRFKLYHEHERPADLPELPANMEPVRATIRGYRWHLWERLLMPWHMQRDGLSVYHGTYNTLPPRWRARPPMVVSIHDVIVTWFDDSLDDDYVRYCRKVTTRVVRQAARILTVSEWSRRDIVERFGADPDKVAVFYNGIHPDFLAGAPPGAGDDARQRFAGGQPYLFAIGAPLPRKNTAGMLAALGALHARRPLEHLVLVSGLAEAQRAPFAQAARDAGIAERVRFLPYVDRRDLVALYAGADLSIYPSRVEGWGIPVIESLSQGTPVVTARTSGMLEAGGDDASYFDPNDRDSMVEGIAAALDGRQAFTARREAAIARARTFTWRRAAEVTLATYRAVATEAL
ncbi:MAG: glycosyltransferase family 1 protein [Planctomycetota bacterium]